MKILKRIWKIGIPLCILFLPQIGSAQQKQSSLSFIIGAYSYTPNLEGLNAIYRTIETNYSLPLGIDFKNYYSIIAGIRFTPVPQQSVQLEISGSVYRTSSSGQLGGNQGANFLSMYSIGGTYRLNIPVGHAMCFLGGGPGYVWLNSERTYAVNSGTASVNGQLAELHGVGGIGFLLPKDASLDLEIGYSYATTLFPDRSDLDFTIKSPTCGIKFNVPLLKY